VKTPGLRLLIIPGLHGSGPDHWQTWLEQQHPGAVRVQMPDWTSTDLDLWVDQIDRTLCQEAGSRWLAVAHSFGCLALARWATEAPERTHQVQGALLVAPAQPKRFEIHEGSLDAALPFPSTLVTSQNDPWFDEAQAQDLGRRWRATLVEAGAQGHLNAESGHGPWPLVHALIDQLAVRRARSGHPRPRLGSWHFAV